MLTYIDGSGNLVKTIPEKVFQGSNYANTIYLIGAYPQASVVEIAFKLPQTGHYTEPYLMLNANIQTPIGVSAWSFDVPLAITEYYGKIEFQVRVLGGQKTIYVDGVQTTVSQTIASAYGTFEVEKGVPVVLPETPSQTIYDQILDLISQIQARINNHDLIGMGILPYSDSFEYPLNALTYNGGNFYRSLQAENIGNPLSDGEWWDEWDISAITSLQERVGTLETTVSGFDGRITQAQTDATSALTKVGRIKVVDNENGSFTFTDGENQQTTINTGSQPDNVTIQINSNDKLEAIAIKDGNGTITPSDVRTNTTNIDIIESKIPAQASSSNQLADKDFVNSSIATNTANFIGTFANVQQLKSIGVLTSGTVLKSGSVIKKHSIINNYTYTSDDTLSVDLVVFSGGTLAFESIIKSGSVLETGCYINHQYYNAQTTTSDDIEIENITNNDYANVINQELDFANTTELNAYDKDLLTNYDYAWVVNGNKYDLYRFDIVTQTWESRATSIHKADVLLIIAYNRYTYNGSTEDWNWNYTVNTSGFTAVQWEAINSGATTELINKIGSDALTTTAQNLSGAVNELNSGKANDGDVVHLTGNETITGIKTFDNQVNFTNSSAAGTNSLSIKNDNGYNAKIKMGSTENMRLMTGGTFFGAMAGVTTDNSYDLGSSSAYWKDLYLKGKIDFADNAIIYKDSQSRIAIKYNDVDKAKFGSLDALFSCRVTPDSSNTYDLGRSGVYWKDLYLSGNLTDGTNTISVPEIAKRQLVAPEYDSTSTYAVGDVVIYDNVLYECNTAISTAEDWTSAHWTAIDVITYVNSKGVSKEQIIRNLPPFKSTIELSGMTANTAYTFPIVSSTNFAVDWGDGTFEFFTTATTSLTHTYTTSATYYVNFYGEWNGIQYTSSSNTSKSLIISVWYDRNIVEIPTYAFYNCNSLGYIKVIGNYIKIYNYAFYTGNLQPLLFVGMENVATINGTEAFENRTLNGRLTLTDHNGNALKIAQRAFDGGRFEELYVYGLNTGFSIGNSAFRNNSFLQKAVFYKGVNTASLGSTMFTSCTNLKTIIIKHPIDANNYIYTFGGNLGSGLSSDLVILVPYDCLSLYKTATNWSTYANQIYPIGGQYSETVTIEDTDWTLNSQTNLYEATATVVGATNESRNILDWSLVDSNGVQIEDTYGLGASAQGSMSITFTAQTAPTSTIYISVQSTLTNYQE